MLLCPNPSCRQPCDADDRFCTECGTRIVETPSVAATCQNCGGTEFDTDGFCTACGVKNRTRQVLTGECIVGPGLAAQTDVGLSISHTHNDDAFSVSGSASGGAGSIIVVCDGVSKSQTPDIAAMVAATAARDTLAGQVAAGKPVEEAVREAIVEAHRAVCAVPFDPSFPVDPPAATIVVAYIAPRNGGLDDGQTATIGWLGDSRVYWLSRSGDKLLTRDHSWINEMVDSGALSYEAARTNELAHAITKCLGTTDLTQSTPCPEPSIVSVDVSEEGWLLACTDGLWNYTEAVGVATAANGLLWTSSAIDVCRALVEFAKNCGGHDNITVAMAKSLPHR